MKRRLLKYGLVVGAVFMSRIDAMIERMMKSFAKLYHDFDQ
jgi:hypothetical protein